MRSTLTGHENALLSAYYTWYSKRDLNPLLAVQTAVAQTKSNWKTAGFEGAEQKELDVLTHTTDHLIDSFKNGKKPSLDMLHIGLEYTLNLTMAQANPHGRTAHLFGW